MKSIAITTRVSTYANHGQACEQNLAFMLTGEVRSHDHVAFDKGSDIPEFHMSVKSARFSLASANLMHAQDFEGQLREYFARVASTVWAYITNDDRAFIMNRAEFEGFVRAFGKMERESSKNGGKMKIRFPQESKAILDYLTSRA